MKYILFPHYRQMATFSSISFSISSYPVRFDVWRYAVIAVLLGQASIVLNVPSRMK